MKKRVIFFTLLFFAALVQPLYTMNPAQPACQEEIAQTMKEPWFQHLAENIRSGKSLKESFEQACEEYAQTNPLDPETAKIVLLSSILKIIGNIKRS